MSKIAAIIVLLLTSVSITHAGEFVPLGRPGASVVFVWKDMDAFKNAVAAVKAGRQREAIMHAACIVPVGTYAEVTGKAGLASKHVLLLDGCSGIVTEEDLNG